MHLKKNMGLGQYSALVSVRGWSAVRVQIQIAARARSNSDWLTFVGASLLVSYVTKDMFQSQNES